MTTEFWVMVSLGVVMLCYGLSSQKRIWDAPTWISFLVIAFLIPQAIYIERSGLADKIDAGHSWLYICLCLIAFWVGFEKSKGAPGPITPSVPFQLIERQLFQRGSLILVLGSFSMLRMNQIANTTELAANWTGVITFLYLLFQLIFLSICLFYILYVVTKKPKYLYVMLFGLGLALIAIAFNAKRSLSAELFFIFAISLYFLKGVKFSRSLVLALMIFGTVLLHQVGTVRIFIDEGRGNAFEAIFSGIPFENFAFFEPKRAPELTQGVVDIYIASKNDSYYGPAYIWNRLVHQYVPAFIFGGQFKESLKIDIDAFYIGGEEHDWSGATRTGFSDSFLGFWYFGALIFFLIGAIMGWVFRYAAHGRIWAIFLYPVILNDSMFALTESTARFFSGSFFVVLVTLFLFVRLPKRRSLLDSQLTNQIFHHSVKNTK